MGSLPLTITSSSEPCRRRAAAFGSDREFAMPQFVMSPFVASPLTQLETLAAVLLMATAVMALVATNARKTRLAESAKWLSFATATGAIFALFGIYNASAQPPTAVASAQDKSIVSVRKLAAFTSNSNGAAKKRGDLVQDCEHCPPLVVVPSGWFTMGASANDPHARPQEMPARTVRLTRDFAIGQTEVTVHQFETFLVNSGHPVPACWATNGGGANAAATCISWQDADAYTRWLKKITGRTYRLPTAAEWEYAARAGSGQPYPVASDAAAVAQAVSFSGRPASAATRILPDGVSAVSAQNQAVGLGSPNYFGLYDVNGGVAELTQDCWSPTLASVSSEGVAADTGANCDRVVKDGMWSEDTKRARFSARRSISADQAKVGIGFRVVRELDQGRN
jgi:formylglycine-generating enzyme required for sulfatase activity